MVEFAPQTTVQRAPSARVSWGATALLGAVLVLGVFFALRVFSFYRKIQNGTIDPQAFGVSRPSTEDALAAFVASAQGKGSGDIATLDDPKTGGSSGAFLTIVEFADFGCPYSRETSGVVRALAKAFPDTVVFQYRDFPIEILHEGAELAAYAGVCAQAQGKFWEMHDVLYAQQDFTNDGIIAAAENVGLDVDTFVTCVNSEDTAAEVDADLADGVDAGVLGTPTFFFNGEKVEGAIPYDLFRSIIETFLAQT